jgi:hypothetical protein
MEERRERVEVVRGECLGEALGETMLGGRVGSW